MKTILSIDPGQNGGYCCQAPDKQIYADKFTSIHDFMCAVDNMKFAFRCPVFAFMERTGTYVPGNSATAAVKFARHCGELTGVLLALKVPVVEIAPQVWQKTMGALPKDKPLRKKEIQRRVQLFFPDVKWTLATADAGGILMHVVSNADKYQEMLCRDL